MLRLTRPHRIRKAAQAINKGKPICDRDHRTSTKGPWAVRALAIWRASFSMPPGVGGYLRVTNQIAFKTSPMPNGEGAYASFAANAD